MEKQLIDTLIQARWVIPVEPHNTYYENYSVAIHDGRIVALLPQEQAKDRFEAREVIDKSKHVVLPGFINAHAHSPMTLLRGLADDMAFMEWLNDYIWPAEKTYLGIEFVKDGTKLALAEMIKGGTIGFNEHYFCYEAIAETVEPVGMRARIGVHLLEIADLVGQSNLDYLQTSGVAFIEKYLNHPLIQPSFAPHSPYGVSLEALMDVKKLSDKYQIPVHLHLQETALELSQYQEKYGKRMLNHLADVGFLSPLIQAVHMTQQVLPEDIAVLKEKGVHVIHCPESNLKLVCGACPVQELLDEGVNVALATDGPASNNDVDMIGEMRTAALFGKYVAKKDTATSAATVLRMATLNGAKAMMWDKETGSLEVGKAADMIAIDLSAPNTQPVYNPISQIVYAAQSHQVTDVWVKGKVLMRDRQLTTLDESAILERAKEWQKKIADTIAQVDKQKVSQ